MYVTGQKDFKEFVHEGVTKAVKSTLHVTAQNTFIHDGVRI